MHPSVRVRFKNFWQYQRWAFYTGVLSSGFVAILGFFCSEWFGLTNYRIVDASRIEILLDEICILLTRIDSSLSPHPAHTPLTTPLTGLDADPSELSRWWLVFAIPFLLAILAGILKGGGVMSSERISEGFDEGATSNPSRKAVSEPLEKYHGGFPIDGGDYYWGDRDVNELR